MLTQDDFIEIGGHYNRGAVPMADYIFYGSNLSEYVPSFDEIDASNESKNRCSLINCSPSLHELLQISIGVSGSTAFNGSRSAFVPPPRHCELMSESIAVAGFELDATGGMSGAVMEIQTREVVRKDPKFRWSVLSNEEGQFYDAMESREMDSIAFTELKAPDGAEIKIKSVREEKKKEQERNLTPNSEPDILSVVENMNVKETDSQIHYDFEEHLGPKQDIPQAEQNSQSRPQLNYRPEFATPIISPTTTFTFTSPPRQKSIHRKAKHTVVGLNGSITILTNAAFLSAPTSGHNNKGHSPCNTVAPSSLGSVLGGEADDDQTGVTTLDSSITQLLEVSSCGGSSAKSDTAFPVDDASYGGGRQDGFSGISSILGGLYSNNKALPFSPEPEANKGIYGKDSETSDVRYLLDIDKALSAAGDTSLLNIGQTDIDDALNVVHRSLRASAGIVGNSFALIRKVTRLLSSCAKMIFSQTCLRPEGC